jgi:hypothetical protein
MLGKSALSDFCSLDVVYLLSGAPKLIGNFNSRLTIGQKRVSSPARTDLGGSDTNRGHSVHDSKVMYGMAVIRSDRDSRQRFPLGYGFAITREVAPNLW